MESFVVDYIHNAKTLPLNKKHIYTCTFKPYVYVRDARDCHN